MSLKAAKNSFARSEDPANVAADDPAMVKAPYAVGSGDPFAASGAILSPRETILLAKDRSQNRVSRVVSESHLPLSPSRKAIASCSTRTASIDGDHGRAWNSKAGSIEQNL